MSIKEGIEFLNIFQIGTYKMKKKKYKGYKKKKCNECGLEYRKMYLMKAGLSLCWKCSRKHYNKINSPYQKPRISMEEALNRIYLVKGYLINKREITAKFSIPNILIGHKIKIVLADNENK